MDESTQIQAPGDSLGAELRKQREIRGISLKEIADATKISRRYLEALESNQHEILPAPVFTRGFVREFARYIGLDSEELADRYSDLVREAEAADADDPLSHSQPLPFMRVDRNIVVFGVLLVAFTVVVWWVWGHMGRPPVEQPVAEASETIAPAEAPEIVESLPEEPEEPVSAAADKLELRIRVIDDTWVILRVDGEVSTNEVLRAGDTHSFSAQNEFRFEVVGNAGGIDLTLNGNSLPSLGARGRVMRDLVFDWNYLENLQGEAPRDDT